MTDEIEAIKAIPLTGLLDEIVCRWNQRGSEIRAKCPIHGGDNQESFAINPKANLFKCHSCDAAGSPIDFVMKYYDVDKSEAIKQLKSRLGMESYTPLKEKPLNMLKNRLLSDFKEYNNTELQHLWNQSAQTGSDSYFESKKVKVPSGIKYHSISGNPLIPRYDTEGSLKSIEQIHAAQEKDGKIFKNYLTGSKRGGDFFTVCEGSSDQIYVAEGISTALSIAEALEHSRCVVSAGSSDNIAKCIPSIRKRNPEKEIVVCLDHDAAGDKSNESVLSLKLGNISFRRPEITGYDFNDTHVNDGLEAVKVQLSRVEKEECWIISDSVSSEEEYVRELKRASFGMSAAFCIGEENIDLPSGAVTIVAAPTSHGKTTFLINLALGVLEENIDKSIYFITYEESKEAVLTSFLNCFQGQRLSKNNRRSIHSYFTEDTSEYIDETQRGSFVESKNIFFETLLQNRSLNVSYSSRSVEEVVSGIRSLAKNDPRVGAVFIDYMQLLHLSRPGASKGSRQEQLKEICLLLKDCAVETGLPIVLGAQFNRKVIDEASMSYVNISEAGDIERVASLIIGFWNRNFLGFGGDGNKTKTGKIITEPREELYVEILKGRQIGAGMNGVFEFSGNKGCVGEQINFNTIKEEEEEGKHVNKRSFGK